MDHFDLRLKSPFTAIISGPTGCGKTELLCSLIHNTDKVCVTPPVEIIYCYGVWQKAFESFEGVRFHEGLIDVKEGITNDGNNRWLILDDLMDEINSETRYSHHFNISSFFVVQNLFKKQLRTMSRNSHYLFLAKSPRDSAFITHLARQVYPSNIKFMIV